jgi:hypothetical protein
MIGSACFALASLPGASSLVPKVVAPTYFLGSIFFTTAAFEQLRTAERGSPNDLVASAVQFVGTLLFNISTFDGMLDTLSSDHEDLLVWTPDVFGSVCFLIASAIALVEVWRQPLFAPARRVARLNMIGSIAFGASAIAAFVLPDTGDLLNASVANSMTLVGALCFLYGAYLLVPRAKHSWFSRSSRNPAAP